jgi:trans-aconitate methyltransferase
VFSFLKKVRWRIAQFIELLWWRNYLKGKTKEEYLLWKKKYWQKFLDDTEVVVAPDSHVMDLGCGPAGIFMLFEQQKVTALDPLLDGYEEKLPHFRKSDYPNVTFLNQALETYDTAKKADVVFCLNAINHVADIEKCFDILVESTESKGDLIVSIDAHNYQIFKYLFRYLHGDILHPHQYDLAEYEKMLTNRNCTIVKKILYKKEFFFDYYILVAKRK